MSLIDGIKNGSLEENFAEKYLMLFYFQLEFFHPSCYLEFPWSTRFFSVTRSSATTDAMTV